jgi:hypothetical protein
MTARKTTATRAKPPGSSWTQGGYRGGALKLMGARRGEGLLVCADLAIPAAYEIDVYAQGEGRRITGGLEGDFSCLVSSDAPDRPLGARLRLDDGREIDIELVDLDDSSARFDLRDDRAGADLLNQARGDILPGGDARAL